MKTLKLISSPSHAPIFGEVFGNEIIQTDTPRIFDDQTTIDQATDRIFWNQEQVKLWELVKVEIKVCRRP